VVEQYFAENGSKHGPFIDSLFRGRVHHLASVSKAVTSVLVGAAIGAFAGGLLIESIGAKGMYFVFCVFVALSLVVISLINRALPPEPERAPFTDSIA